ncbi:hypothetical protein BGY98DRAFT_325256 [Russula aff. rugulosa BPL654]|nr:hypothetical protein BGY98DRAFT_325256 [Russula aff. rugulosa BPL654]
MWAQVLVPGNMYHRQLIDQVVATAVPESTDPDDVSVTLDKLDGPYPGGVHTSPWRAMLHLTLRWPRAIYLSSLPHQSPFVHCAHSTLHIVRNRASRCQATNRARDIESKQAGSPCFLRPSQSSLPRTSADTIFR